MTELYIVFKYGVYRQECGGVYESEGAALDAARHLKELEGDDYHDFEVVPFLLNEVPESITSHKHSTMIHENEQVFDTKKDRKINP